jgi:hypothetical protein
MEITPLVYDSDEEYINQIIMIPNSDGALNSFYKIIRFTDKMCHLKKIKDETILKKTYFDEENNRDTNIYEAKILKEFVTPENIIDKRIRKINIKNYSVIFVSFVQYEI